MISEQVARIELSWREDGGLRVTSETHPGLVLSHPRANLVMLDVLPALAVMGFKPEAIGALPVEKEGRKDG